MKTFYKVIFVLIFQYSIFNLQSFSQTAPGIEWQNTIGGDVNDRLSCVAQSLDEGFIAVGASQSDVNGDKNEYSCNYSYDYWVVKMDTTGYITWQNTIGGSDIDYLYFIKQTSDSGYILGGNSYSNISCDKTENNIGIGDYWIVKLDAGGTIQWQNAIGGTGNDNLYCVEQTTDGGYVLGGYSNSGISVDKTETGLGGYDYWIVKTDSAGNIVWQNTIGGDADDLLIKIQQTTDGGYILAGFSQSNISGDKTENNIGAEDYWIVKTDYSGIIQWQNTIGGAGSDFLYSTQQTSDGGYILGGYSGSGISGDKTEICIGLTDYWIVKTNSSGNIQWQNTIGGNDDDKLYSIQQTLNGGYIFGGSSESNISGDKNENSIGNRDYWIIKTDSFGNIQWQNTIGGSSHDILYSLQQTKDGGYFLGGESVSSISGDKTEDCLGDFDYWVIKLFPDTITGIPNLQSSINNLQFILNPLTTQSKLTFKNTNKEKFLFTLYDITGRVTETVSTVNNEIILTKGSKQAGVYLFRLENAHTREVLNGKIIIQ